MVFMDEADIVVVGAGPAGSTAAEHAARHGANVILIERRKIVGHPVRCGELVPSKEEIGLIFPGVEDLEGLFDMPSSLRKGDIEAIRTQSPMGTSFLLPFKGYTTDRTEFDQHLASKAQAAGARLMIDTQFRGFEQGTVRTDIGDIKADMVIGADGPGSRVARSLGLDRVKVLYPAVTAQAKGDFEPVCDMFFGSVAPGAYGWIIPKYDGANIGVGCSPKFARGRLMEYFWKYVEDHGFELSSDGVTGGKYVPSSGPSQRTVCEHGMIVGDAAGHVMAVNGGGIPIAMICGRIAGRVAGMHVSDGTPLIRYQEEWRSHCWKPLRTAVHTKWMADLMFGSNRRLEFSMKILGPRRMGKIIRCKPPFP